MLQEPQPELQVELRKFLKIKNTRYAKAATNNIAMITCCPILSSYGIDSLNPNLRQKILLSVFERIYFALGHVV